MVRISIFKKKSVRTQFGLRHSLNALIIEITLFGIRKKSVVFRTVKRGCKISKFFRKNSTSKLMIALLFSF